MHKEGADEFNEAESGKQRDMDSGIGVCTETDERNLSNSKDELAEPSGKHDETAIVRTLNEMLAQVLANKLQLSAQQEMDEIVKDWRLVAEVCDRILFFLFTGAVLVISIWFLTLNPSAESQRIYANEA